MRYALPSLLFLAGGLIAPAGSALAQDTIPAGTPIEDGLSADIKKREFDLAMKLL